MKIKNWTIEDTDKKTIVKITLKRNELIKFLETNLARAQFAEEGTLVFELENVN